MLPLAGLPSAMFQTWQTAEPDSTVSIAGGDFAGDCRRYAAYWQLTRELLRSLPAKPTRNVKQASAAETIQQKAHTTQQHNQTRHVASVYESLTQNNSKFLRVET